LIELKGSHWSPLASLVSAYFSFSQAMPMSLIGWQRMLVTRGLQAPHPHECPVVDDGTVEGEGGLHAPRPSESPVVHDGDVMVEG
jgi:hypothetical protein